MRLIDADALYRIVKTECNPYGKPTIKWDDGMKVMEWIDSAPTVGGWVSVKDRLPENETEVIIIVQHRIGWYRAFAWHDAYGWHSIADEFCDGDSDLVTHWMPLPKPPKEVTKDG